MIERFFLGICLFLALTLQHCYANTIVANPGTGDRYTANPAEHETAQQTLDQAVILIHEHKLVQAEQLLQRLIRDYPENPVPYLNLAVISAQQNQLNTAREQLERAQILAPAMPETKIALAHTYLGLAWQSLNKAIALNGKTSNMQTEQWKHEREVIGKLIDDIPDSRQAAPASAQPPSADNRQAASKPDAIGNQDEMKIRQTIGNWRTAWASANLSDYLAFYADEFKPERGSLTEWRLKKQKIFAARPEIDLQTSILSVTQQDQTVFVRLKQRYHAGRMHESGIKLLSLKKYDAQWLITQEKFLKTPD